MKTRRGNSYPVAGAPATNTYRKIWSTSARCNFFDTLPDDLVLSILVKLSSSAVSPADFASALLTCKKFNDLGMNPLVLSKASAETFAVKSKNWSLYPHRFLQRSAEAGNAEASYILGMIQFYCYRNRKTGAALMAKAAIKSHAPALYSLAIIQFNGSGNNKNIRDSIGGVTLCARAAYLGHVDAMRELGHCLKDGFGVGRNVTEGQKFINEANARELAAICSNPSPELIPDGGSNSNSNSNTITYATLIGDSGFTIPPPKTHPANRFLADWFTDHTPGSFILVCDYGGCGRPETRMQEFRRCSACGVKHYCSRGCQARHWMMGHNKDCRPVVRFPIINAVDM